MADVRLTNAKDVEESKDDIKNDINLRLANWNFEF